ncbi:MAG: PAS domain S-box protein [Desulfobacterales bacterium]|nr:PAS domain S-box protein [Desulfobacterales bacterium]MDJ0854503.1 PAS domain S-box protein [Desulfobacterales bacterium]
MLILAVALVAMGIGIYWLANTQISILTAQFQQQLYAEKLDTIISTLDQDNQKLEKTGLVEAYRAAFQEAALLSLRDTFGKQDIRPLVLNASGRELIWENSGLLKPDVVARAHAAGDDLFAFVADGGFWVIGRAFAPWKWRVLYVLSEAERHSQALLLSRQLAAVIVAVLAVTAGLLILSVSRLTRPISALTAASTAMADGDLDHALPAVRKDEIGQLAQSFRIMRDAIRTQLASLEKEISERKQIEHALRESEQKYRQLIENANDAVFITQDGQIKFANRRTSKIIGYSAEELGAVSFVEFIHPEDRDMVIDRHRRRLAGETGIPNTYAFRVINRDGDERVLQLSIAVIEWNAKPAVLNFMRDITDQRQLEASLQQAQKMEAIGTLAGGIAHDFNNLLLGVQGRASLMALDLPAAHPHHEHIQAIEDYVRSATNLTRQLLGVGRGGKYEPKPSDLNELVTASSSMFGRTRKEIQVRLDLSAQPVVADVDRQQIEQVLLNMYVNAWQAMPDGGELFVQTDAVVLDPAACALHEARPGNYARIAVTDTGVGMDAAIREKIFDPFFTTKEKARGTGLGLASAYGIVKNHDGFITVHSEPGRGSTFDIYLPASQEAVAQSVPAKDTIVRGTETILLVDDEEMIIEVGRAILEKLGYRVLVARGGEEALAAVAAQGDAIDLVILDLIMPGMDGGRTFDRLRTLAPALPVILSSGYAIDGQAAEIMRRGCNGFLQKPFNVARLSRKIRQVLNATAGV